MTGLYAHLSASDLEQLQRDADSSLLHYGTSFHPDIITRAHGNSIFTSSGHTMLDWTSGQMSTLISHGNPEIRHAVPAGDQPGEEANLGKKLTGLLPEGLDKALFLSTGGESNEYAIRLAKLYTGKHEIVGLSSSWHGITSGANGAHYHSRNAGYGPTMPGNLMISSPNAYRSIFRHADGSHDWQTELDYGFSLVDQQSSGSLAAILVEPILSSGGMHPLPPGYLRALKQHCEKRDMLLIVDEAQTSIGRAGDLFAFTHDGDGVVPEILTLSKTLGNGPPLTRFLFYTTHVNDPIPAAVGEKVLDIVVRDNLVEHARSLGLKLQAGLRRLQSRYGCIGDVRGRGLMAGVEIVAGPTSKTPAPEVGARVAGRMYELGLWAQLATMASFGGVFRIAPPLTTTEEELERGLAIMEEALRVSEGTLPLYLDDGIVESTAVRPESGR
ncbi:Uu.00g066480.m01.CDS01 [Anthostomella pinea]|uniref:Uu.00g066480.m01.CDS01 n=1 Tax=Anthostomella pinea TaxID=933095 RepID=A0AAI8VV62_9PEZI|nr:Uu.00g066480.m01.CDS01 [Anthostomella pinea]